MRLHDEPPHKGLHDDLWRCRSIYSWAYACLEMLQMLQEGPQSGDQAFWLRQPIRDLSADFPSQRLKIPSHEKSRSKHYVPEAFSLDTIHRGEVDPLQRFLATLQISYKS